MKSYLMSPEMKTPSYLANEIGQLGKPSALVVPEEFLKQWAPTGLSLEEINRRKEAIRQFQRETSTNIIDLYLDSAGAVQTASYVMRAIPTNKVYQVFNIQISGFATATGATCGYITIHVTDTGGNAVYNLASVIFPPPVAGQTPPYTTLTVPLPSPIKVLSGQKITASWTDYQGVALCNVYYWEEDKDIIA